MKNKYAKVTSGGVDVHYRFSRVTLRDGEGEPVRRERIEHPDRDALRKRLSAWPKDMEVVLEASFGWGWLSDLMREVGLKPTLSNCLKVERMRQARGWVKTNGKDADLLSLLPYEAQRWWEVWMAPPEVRDHREWMRYRADLVCIQTATKNRIHAIFHRHGIFHEFSDLFGAGGRVWLHELCQRGHPRLPEGAWAALRGQVQLLDHVRSQLAAVERQLHAKLERTPLCRRIDTVPGFGLILSHTLIAEVGCLERFANDGKLASYALLAPRSHDSGQEDTSGRAPLGRHLGHAGNRTLKWVFIEAAHGAVRKGGRWRAMFDRVTQGGKKDRNRGYIKVARELLKVVYAMWKNGTQYQETPPRRPGVRRRGRRLVRERASSATL